MHATRTKHCNLFISHVSTSNLELHYIQINPSLILFAWSKWKWWKYMHNVAQTAAMHLKVVQSRRIFPSTYSWPSFPASCSPRTHCGRHGSKQNGDSKLRTDLARRQFQKDRPVLCYRRTFFPFFRKEGLTVWRLDSQVENMFRMSCAFGAALWTVRKFYRTWRSWAGGQRLRIKC